MKNSHSSSMNSRVTEDMKDQNLCQEVEHLHMTNQFLWSLLVDISKKIQVSSAAIKASVSSLLDYEIILDVSTQHELLEIIDNSSDQVSKYVMLLTLVSKMESNTFTLSSEPIDISEMLSSVNEIITRNYPKFILKLSTQLPREPVCIDYEYLSIALVMLFELILETQTLSQELSIVAAESEKHWYVDIEEISKDALDAILKISTREDNELLQDYGLLPTAKLRLYVVRKIFELLSIQISTISESNETTGIRLMIPIVKRND